MNSPPLEGGEGPCEILQDAGQGGLTLLTNSGGEGRIEGRTGTGGGVVGGVEDVGLGGMVTGLEGGQGVQGGPRVGNTAQDALSLLQGDLVPHTNFTHTFLKSILTSIDSKDPVVANAWLETLLDVIDLLPRDVIREEILSLAVTKGQSQQVSARLAACKLIGKIATKFEPFLLKTEVVGVVQSLCQDVCGEVRGSMCGQLAAVARGLGLDATKTHILPELVDLCSDEETSVRLAGINTVVLMIPLLDDETRVGTLVPLVRKVCERALRVEDASLPVTAHLLGRLCHGLHDELTEEQKSWFLNFYCTLAKLGLPDCKKTELPMPDLVAEVRSGEYEAECRQQCAYNLPCMVAFAGGSTTYRTSLHPTVSSLLTDPSHQVRVTVAAAFHQLCTLVGAEVGLLKEGLLQLLRSDSLEVLAALTPNLPNIISTMHRHNAIAPQSPRGELLEVVGAVKQGEETVSITSMWRVHAECLTQAAALAPCLPPDLLFTQLVPLMVVRMQTARPIPCRLAAARTLLVFLHHMTSTEHREHICNTLISEFCEGNSCHKRMLFLNIATMILEMFSKLFFKTYFFRPLLSLHSDRVPNIRLKLVTLLPQMKATLSLPEDKTRLQELETVVGSLLVSEVDRDVSAAVSTTITLLDKIEVCESQRGSPEGESAGQETEDEKKEKQEQRTLGDTKGDEKTSPGEGNGNTNRGEGDTLGERRSGTRSSSRRSTSGVSRLPPYLERRRSNSHAPKQPPDEHTILRGGLKGSAGRPSDWSLDDEDEDEVSSELDLSDMCDEVLLSPEEPSVSWEEQLSPGSPPPTTRHQAPPSPPSPGPPSHTDLHLPPREARDRLADARKLPGGRRPPYPEGGERGGEELSAREVFWLRTSRPRWRRKVASADTSPEEPRRHRFGRGWSVDGRGSHSDTEDPEVLYEGRRLRSQEAVTPTPGPHPSASPPSPHGMYTWPPQHTRHRHHSASEGEDYEGEEGLQQSSPPQPPDSYHTLARRRGPSSSSTSTSSSSSHYLDPVPTSRPNGAPRRREAPEGFSSRPGQGEKTPKRNTKMASGPDSPGIYSRVGQASYHGHHPARPREPEDPYLYHSLPPTLPPHLYAPPTMATHFTYDTPEDYLPMAFPEPYSPDPYRGSEAHMRDPYGHYLFEERPEVRPLDHLPHSFFLLDTAELAPWSSPPAYPIGPLGASWLQHGLHPLARIPPCLIPAPYSRPRPPAPLASPPWRLSHPASFPSLTALDPSTDEFLVDAGIRIDESVIRSRLPGPQTPPRLARWRTTDRPYPSPAQDTLDAKGRPSSRLRQPTIVTASRIPAPPGALSHLSEGHETTLRKSDGALDQRRRSQGPGSSGSPSGVVTRLRPPQRPGRPASTVAPTASHGPLTSRTKSLSHENLRTSPSRLALPSSPTLSPNSSRAPSPHTSPQEEGRPRTLNVAGSRLRQPQVRTSRGRGSRPTSCSSSPGGSRCSSPGLEGPVGGFGRGSRSGSRASSTSSSPATSRCSSPAGEELRPLARAPQHRANSSTPRNGSSSRPARRTSNTSLQEQVTTPPSPGPTPRQPHLQGSAIPKPSSTSRTKPGTSKLPLPMTTKS